MDANTMGVMFNQMLHGQLVTEHTFTPREISMYLNLGVKEFIDRRALPDANTKRKGFEADGKRLIDIAPLVSSQRDVYLRENNDFVRGTYMNGAIRSPDRDTEGVKRSGTSGYGTVTDAEDAKYGVLVELKDEVLYILSENCDISTAGGADKEWRNNVKVEHVDNVMYNTLVYNTYKNPDVDLIWRREYGSSLPSFVFTAGKEAEFRSTATLSTRANPISMDSKWRFDGTRRRIIELIAGKGMEIEKYNLYYIRKPKDIVVDFTSPNKQIDCELHPHIHSEIVEIAVRKAVESLAPAEQKYQLMDKENKENE